MHEPKAVPALLAPPRKKDNPFTRSVAGMVGAAVLAIMLGACLFSLPWTMGEAVSAGAPRYRAGNLDATKLPPSWIPHTPAEREQIELAATAAARASLAAELGLAPEDAPDPTPAQIDAAVPIFPLGADQLGRDLLTRILVGGGISLGIGLSAAFISVLIGTAYGMIAGWFGGRVDAVMMRIVDILYGLPYILLVVLLAVAADSLADRAIARSVSNSAIAREAFVEREIAALPPAQREDDEAIRSIEAEASRRFSSSAIESRRSVVNIVTLLVAIGGVSWLTMARVVRGQVLSLKNQPFVEAALAVGAPTRRIFLKHLLPNLLGPIIVYATLTVPQAILQESFLSFLGIGVMPPMPSWGNLAAAGLNELNTVRSRWWLLVFPCAMLGVTLLALNFVGEGLREAFDPKRAR
jgi:ABC-type dipeptide/oligopeptide/nickel transport system permease subunit